MTFVDVAKICFCGEINLLTVAANRPTRLGYNIVVGARDKKVYFYNGSTVLAKMPLIKFVSIR